MTIFPLYFLFFYHCYCKNFFIWYYLTLSLNFWSFFTFYVFIILFIYQFIFLILISFLQYFIPPIFPLFSSSLPQPFMSWNWSMFPFHSQSVFSPCLFTACGHEGRCGMWPWQEWAHPDQRSGDCSGLLNTPLIPFHVLLQEPKGLPAENDHLPFADDALSYWNTVSSSRNTLPI